MTAGTYRNPRPRPHARQKGLHARVEGERPGEAARRHSGGLGETNGPGRLDGVVGPPPRIPVHGRFNGALAPTRSDGEVDFAALGSCFLLPLPFVDQVVAEGLTRQQFRPRHALDVVGDEVGVLAEELPCADDRLDREVVPEPGDPHPEVPCRRLSSWQVAGIGRSVVIARNVAQRVVMPSMTYCLRVQRDVPPCPCVGHILNMYC